MKKPAHEIEPNQLLTDELLRIAAAKSAEAYVEALTNDFGSGTQPDE